MQEPTSFLLGLPGFRHAGNLGTGEDLSAEIFRNRNVTETAGDGLVVLRLFPEPFRQNRVVTGVLQSLLDARIFGVLATRTIGAKDKLCFFVIHGFASFLGCKDVAMGTIFR